MFPKLQNRKLDIFSLHKREDKIYGEFRDVISNYPKDTIPLKLTRNISLSVELYNLPVEKITSFKYQNAYNEKMNGKRLSARYLYHEIGHALVEQIVNDKSFFKKEIMDLNVESRNKYLSLANKKREEMTNRLYEVTCQKLFINYSPQSPQSILEKLNTKLLLTPYSSVNTKECFSEAFADFLTNESPSIFSVTMMKTFKEMYPEYVDQDLFNKRIEEINNAWNNFPPELKTKRIATLTELRGEAEYKSINIADNTLFLEFKKFGRLDGPFEIETNDFVTYVRAYETLKQFHYRQYIQDIPDVIMSGHKYDESSNKSKFIFILAAKDIMESRGIDTSKVNMYLNSFKDIELTKELAAAKHLYDNFSNKAMFYDVFTLNNDNSDINWNEMPKDLKKCINKLPLEDIQLLAETLPVVVNYKHEQGETEAIDYSISMLNNKELDNSKYL
jgi:hypothetical protein